MENLIIDNGIIEIKINNDDNKIISFCPSDINIFTRYNNIIYELDKKNKEYSKFIETEKDINKQIEKIKELDIFVKEKIDYIFNADISSKLFGNISCFSKGKNKKPIYENVITSLLNLCEKSYNNKINNIKHSDKAKKYLGDYKIKHYDNKKSN